MPTVTGDLISPAAMSSAPQPIGNPRLVVRHWNELTYDRGARLRRMFEVDHLNSLLLPVLMSGNLAHRPLPGQAHRPRSTASPPTTRIAVRQRAGRVAVDAGLPYDGQAAHPGAGQAGGCWSRRTTVTSSPPKSSRATPWRR
ncbi:hypothetical protein AB5I41_08140 [Sphingomonas sp. MMS24-JH45]